MNAFQRADTALVEAMLPTMGLIVFPEATGAVDAATDAAASMPKLSVLRACGGSALASPVLAPNGRWPSATGVAW